MVFPGQSYRVRDLLCGSCRLYIGVKLVGTSRVRGGEEEERGRSMEDACEDEDEDEDEDEGGRSRPLCSYAHGRRCPVLT
eukprot:3125965-Rhodomonas_salina.1